jgi:hypothetical protein
MTRSKRLHSGRGRRKYRSQSPARRTRQPSQSVRSLQYACARAEARTSLSGCRGSWTVAARLPTHLASTGLVGCPATQPPTERWKKPPSGVARMTSPASVSQHHAIALRERPAGKRDARDAGDRPARQISTAPSNGIPVAPGPSLVNNRPHTTSRHRIGPLRLRCL